MDNSEQINKVKALIDGLPKPYSQEEQYLYALVCDMAGVAPKEGYLVNNITFKSPFWRMQQYWHAFCQATELRFDLPTIPSANTVSMDSLTSDVKEHLVMPNNIGTEYIKDYAITEDKLDTSVDARLLGPQRITEGMLVNALADKLLGSKRITEAMLTDALVAKLLGEKKVTKDMLSTEVQEILDKVG